MNRQEVENEIFSECYQFFVSIIEDKLDELGHTEYSVADIDIKLKEVS